MPPLLECYQKRDYDEDDDDYLNVPIKASTCIKSIASIARDTIVPMVLPQIQKSIAEEDWKQKESATLLFANILEGPSEQVMTELISQILPLLFTQLQHES